MVPPDGARSKRIPTLSWDSVVSSTDQPEPTASPTPDAGVTTFDEPVTLAPLTLDLSSPEVGEPVIEGPITFEPLQLDSLPGNTTHESKLAPPPAPPLAPPIPKSPIPSREVVEPVVADAPITVRTSPPVVIVPALGDVTSGPERLEPVTIAAPESNPTALAPTDGLPEIVEATPFVARGGPVLPSMPAAASRPTVAPSVEFIPTSPALAPGRQHQRRSTRRGVKLVATLVVLGGLVAAGVILGQPYLFPGEWDTATAPYADAVEAGRGVEFAEPLAIVAEPTAEFGTRLRAQLAPESAEELTQWRSLGLVSGLVDDSTLVRQLTGWQDAIFSTSDGQVYHDLGVAGPELDAQLVREMTAASLDQEYGWSSEQPERTLDAAAATSAEVLRQSRALQQSSAFDAEVTPVPSELVGPLPPITGYRMLAPHVFAEFDTPLPRTEGTNPLAGLGPAGPEIFGDGELGAADPAMMMGRSFWYLVFAGYLDARTAYSASEAVVESALTWAERDGVQCAAATFSGGGVEQTATMRWALTAWASTAPAEMSSSFQVLPDGSLQLVSCDPGAGFDAGVRPGIARELIAWRTVELATIEAVRASGGGEAELSGAWALVQAAPVATDLMDLPATTTPAEMALAAREGVGALLGAAG
jgi:hypothetical protein